MIPSDMDAVERVTKERDHWKANHDQQVELKRQLHERYEAARDAIAQLLEIPMLSSSRARAAKANARAVLDKS